MSQMLPDVTPFEDILSEQQKADLRKALASIPDLRRNIQKAQRAGIDIGDQLERLDILERDYNKLLAELR